MVDDDIDTLFLLTFTLEECGAKVAAALSTSEAIEVFKEFHPTLLISNIGLITTLSPDLAFTNRSKVRQYRRQRA